MQVDINRLKGCIVARGMTHEAVAKEIGVDCSTFSRKMCCGGLSFSVAQVHKLIDVLHLDNAEAAAIFLHENSQKCEQ